MKKVRGEKPTSALIASTVTFSAPRAAATWACNTASVEKLRTTASGLLTLSGEARGRLERLSASLTDCPGPRRAYDALHRLPV